MNRPLTRVVLAACALIACSDRARDAKPDAAPPAGAAVPPGTVADHFSSTTLKFDLDLPGVWTGHYTTVERADTSSGAHHAVEFLFKPDASSKAKPLTLMKIRLFTRATWAARQGPAIGAKLGENASDVFILSLPASNPYPPNSPEAPVFDRLIISIANGGQPVRFTTR